MPECPALSPSPLCRSPAGAFVLPCCLLAPSARGVCLSLALCYRRKTWPRLARARDSVFGGMSVGGMRDSRQCVVCYCVGSDERKWRSRLAAWLLAAMRCRAELRPRACARNGPCGVRTRLFDVMRVDRSLTSLLPLHFQQLDGRLAITLIDYSQCFTTPPCNARQAVRLVSRVWT